jgi:hypothetical protein
MENIIEKLNQIDEDENYTKSTWNNWTLEDKKKLLDIYYIISKKEGHIFELIYRYHGCDSWEDIFRDYNIKYLEDKTIGVEIAIDEITYRLNQIKEEKK